MAARIMRPNSVSSFRDMDYIDTDTNIGEDTLGPGFKKHLESFYQKASPEDKARCLELLTALDIGKAARDQSNLLEHYSADTTDQIKRPRTAMAALDRPREQNGDLSSYTTTYARTYYAPPGPAGCAERPGSSHAFQAPYRLSGPIGSTTYGSEFYRKGQRKAEPIRTGTASGNRRNNPHPLETFMNWKLPPRPMAEQNYSDWGIELTDEVMDKVCRGQLASTYQTDYLGIPQGYQVKHALGTTIPSDWKSRVTYSLDSSMRNSYRPPCQKKELKGNMKRYGCNKLKNTPAHGVVPTVSTRQMNIKSRTSYERDFITPANAHVRFDTKDVRDLARKHGANAILKYFKNADGKGTEELTRMLDAMNIHPPTGSRPVTSTDPRSRVKTPTSSYHSTWLGPM